MKQRTNKTGPAWVLSAIVLGAFFTFSPQAEAALSPSTLLSRADAEFRVLRGRKSLQKYRHNYDKVEKLYLKVLDSGGGGKEAAEALLRCGELNTLLYRWTSSRKDLDSSKAYYARLLDEYPGSPLADDARAETALLYLNYYNDPAQAYREFEKVVDEYPRGDRAEEARRWLGRLKRYKAKAVSAPPPAAPSKTASPSGAAALLSRADRDFAKLKSSVAKQRYRHNYGAILASYRRVFDGSPESPEAVLALYRAGELHTLLYRWTSSNSDLNSAKHYYERVYREYPDSDLADDARMAVAFLYLRQYGDPIRAYREFEEVASSSRSDRRAEAQAELNRLSRFRPGPEDSSTDTPEPPATGELARVTGIRHWSNPEYTRVVIDLDRSSNFYSNLLDESSELNKPPRLYVDLFNSVVENRLRTTIPVNDGILLSIRSGQFSASTVRVVLDIDKLQSFTIFHMENPFRIVIDARGGAKRAPPPQASAPSVPSTDAGRPYSLAQQLGLGIRKIVIDAGHGARDPGALGLKGLKEKDVTLDLALRLRDLLRPEGLQVILTRDSDVYIGLEERTAIANRSHGDLFLSLHANSSKRQGLRGIETYFLNLASSQRAMETAALENSMSLAKMSDLEGILREIFNSKMDESSRLAETVQKNMVENLRRHYKDVKDLGVKQAPFYVLIGAQMPSILAEVSFINHPVEGARLASGTYRQHVAESIAKGVVGYITSVKTAAVGR